MIQPNANIAGRHVETSHLLSVKIYCEEEASTQAMFRARFSTHPRYDENLHILKLSKKKKDDVCALIRFPQNDMWNMIGML